jgi:hypothetical protein
VKKFTKKGIFTPNDKLDGNYQLLPFTVPQGTRRIELLYTYDRESGNVLDIGLFDPRGHDFPSAEGFRGWSGSARDHVVVTEHRATPGYLPGPLIPGTWHVILGLYQVASNGCPYKLEMLISEEERKPPGPSEGTKDPTSLSPHGGPDWFKGDLHSHTAHSDARCSVAEIGKAAQSRGLAFLAVTDHNTTSHYPYLITHSSPSLLLVPGQEVTTYHGHANVWGSGQWLDFRCRNREEMATVIAEAHREGRLFSVNHPKPGGPEWTFGLDLPFDCVEVWQRPWPWNNEQSLAFWRHLLRKGRRVIAVGGSDSHPYPLSNGRLIEWLGYPTTWVYAEALTTKSVLAGIKSGHVSISSSPSAPRATLAVREDGYVALQGSVVDMEKSAIEAHVLGGEGCWLRILTARGETAREIIPSPDYKYCHQVALSKHGYVRVEVRAPGSRSETAPGRLPMVAMTNPVWYTGFLNSKKLRWRPH